MGFALFAVLLLSHAAIDARELKSHSFADSLGKQLFEGRAPVPAKMSGHSAPLPVAASRCSNCHTNAVPATSKSALSSQNRSFGTPLNQTTLNALMARRGGPATRYDALSFCRVIREDVDPSHVVINSAMPRYSVSDAQCVALWSYVMSYS